MLAESTLHVSELQLARLPLRRGVIRTAPPPPSYTQGSTTYVSATTNWRYNSTWFLQAHQPSTEPLVPTGSSPPHSHTHPSPARVLYSTTRRLDAAGATHPAGAADGTRPDETSKPRHIHPTLGFALEHFRHPDIHLPWWSCAAAWAG